MIKHKHIIIRKKSSYKNIFERQFIARYTPLLKPSKNEISFDISLPFEFLRYYWSSALTNQLEQPRTKK